MVRTGMWKTGSMFSRSLEEESMVVDKDSSKIMETVKSWIRGSLIGAGAFGKVNLALNRENGDLFAVKSIECNERTSNEMQAMENEVQILQCLNSPFIVKCLGSAFSVENGKSMRNVYMEYMSGGSVADLMKKFGGRFEETLIRNYTRSILEGIRYLHSQDIVHCDIKGRNVLVGSTGVKLADFGGARRLDGDAALMVDSDLLKVKGTPLWMAPEVVRQVEQGPASDIWSLGCTVVEMATGKAPWSDIAGASNPFVALYHIGCTEEVPDLPSCLSEQGQDFLSKCFQRDPRVRWTAGQLLQHPFITDNFVAIQSIKPTEQSSPTSAFDFPSSSCATLESSIVNSVPILRSPQFTKRCPQEQQAANFFQTEEVLVKHKESTTTSSSSSVTDFWCNSPLSDLPGQWIVVHTPKTISPVFSPTLSSAARKLFAVSRVEEPENLLSHKCKHPSVEVEEIPEIASCSSTETGIRMGDDEQRESTERTAEQASCSTAIQSSTYNKNWDEKVEDDTMCGGTIKQEGWDSGRRAVCRSSSTTGPRKKKLSRSRPDCDHLENCCHPSAAPAVGDSRFIDSRGRPKLKYAALRDTHRILSSAHRKLSFSGRSEPRKRFRVRRELRELLKRITILGRSLYSLSFRKIFIRHERIPKIFIALLFGAELQPSFFRNRLFLNKRPSPRWQILYTFSILVLNLSCLVHTSMIFKFIAHLLCSHVWQWRLSWGFHGEFVLCKPDPFGGMRTSKDASSLSFLERGRPCSCRLVFTLL